MGLPPRPKNRPLVRRAIVASVLVTAGCDQGAKPSPPPERKEHVPPKPLPADAPQPEPVAVAPQVAYANGFTLELVDTKGKPLAGVHAKVTLNRGETFEVTTSERGEAYVTTRIDGGDQATIEAAGYARVEDAYIDGGMSPSLRVVLRKQKQIVMPR